MFGKSLRTRIIPIFCASVENPCLGATWTEDCRLPKWTEARMSSVRPPPIRPHKSMVFRGAHFLHRINSPDVSRFRTRLSFSRLQPHPLLLLREEAPGPSTTKGDPTCLMRPDVAGICAAATTVSLISLSQQRIETQG